MQAPTAIPARPGSRSTGPPVTRDISVKPSMCGPTALFMAQAGDWTWDTVSHQCDIDVLQARTSDGHPTYLSFYYFHIHGDPALHPLHLDFGDPLTVQSQAFDCGSQSVLVLHRLSGKPGPEPDRALSPAEFRTDPRPGRLYIESFNRWISRSSEHSNTGLRNASPQGFRHRHLPELPSQDSPRALATAARHAGSLTGSFPPDLLRVSEPFRTSHRIDLARDLNGVRLLYFASYFSIVDAALLAHWRHLGRSDASFLERRVTDQKMCYFGNADIDATLDITVSAFTTPHAPGAELIDIRVHDQGTGRLLAVNALRLQGPLS